jgi:hypothetical protein
MIWKLPWERNTSPMAVECLDIVGRALPKRPVPVSATPVYLMGLGNQSDARGHETALLEPLVELGTVTPLYEAH